MADFTVTINGKSCAASAGMTILEAARENGIRIPTLCHFEGLEGRANCRMCVVEVEGMRTSQPACVTRVRDGMVVNTDTEKLRSARKATLELLLAHHAVDCHHCLRIGSSSEQSLDPRFCEMCFWCDCVRDGFCELQALAREYHVDVLPYIQHEKDYEEDCSLDSITRNPNKCVKCRRCVDVCGSVQTVHNLSMANRGRDIMVVHELGKPMAESACVRCGHCVDVCPVGAIYMKEHKDEVLYMAHSYDVDVAAQLSADVLPELTALYKAEAGEITMERVCAALHKIGIKTVISDEHAKALAARQAAEIIEKNVEAGPVILTNSPAVMNFVGRYFAKIKVQIHTYDSAQAAFSKTAAELSRDKPLKIYNSNLYVLRALLEQEGYEVGDCVHMQDDEHKISEIIRRISETSDLILTTGGASVGDKDFALSALERTHAEILFARVRMKPGSCTFGAKLGNALVVSFSGNPGAALTAYYRIALPAIRKLAGRRDCVLHERMLPIQSEYRKSCPSPRILKGHTETVGGVTYFVSHDGQKNGMQTSFLRMDALAELPPMDAPLAAGALVRVFFPEKKG